MLDLILKCCYTGELLTKSHWNAKYAKSVQKDHKRTKKMAKSELRSPKCKESAPNQNGEPPKSPLCAVFNRTSPLEASQERANMARNGESPKANGECMLCAEMKKKKMKSASQEQNGEPPNANGELIEVAESSRGQSKSASSSQTASRRSVRRTKIRSPNWKSGIFFWNI